MFCCRLLYVHSSIAIILMGKRELVALFNLSSWCLVVVERLFLAVPWGCLRFVIGVFPDHTHLLFFFIVSTVPSEIQWTSFFFFKMSLMISFRTEILHMYIIYHRLIYNCMFDRLRSQK